MLQFVTAFYETIHEFGCFKKKKITITIKNQDNERQNEEVIELNQISAKSFLSFLSQK